MTGEDFQIGRSAEIYCILNSVGLERGLNSSNLSFEVFLYDYEGVKYNEIPVQLTDSSSQVCTHRYNLPRN